MASEREREEEWKGEPQENNDPLSRLLLIAFSCYVERSGDTKSGTRVRERVI
jgi:hypothetical protein